MIDFKVGDAVFIPDCELGEGNIAGKIVAIWSDKMAVDFGGRLGHYTISKHKIIPAEYFGIKITLSNNNPIQTIKTKYDNRGMLMDEKKYTIEELEEKLRLETERADRNYQIAIWYENLYNKAIDWITDEPETDCGDTV